MFYSVPLMGLTCKSTSIDRAETFSFNKPNPVSCSHLWYHQCVVWRCIQRTGFSVVSNFIIHSYNVCMGLLVFESTFGMSSYMSSIVILVNSEILQFTAEIKVTSVTSCFKKFWRNAFKSTEITARNQFTSSRSLIWL